MSDGLLITVSRDLPATRPTSSAGNSVVLPDLSGEVEADQRHDDAVDEPDERNQPDAVGRSVGPTLSHVDHQGVPLRDGRASGQTARSPTTRSFPDSYRSQHVHLPSIVICLPKPPGGVEPPAPEVEARRSSAELRGRGASERPRATRTDAHASDETTRQIPAKQRPGDAGDEPGE